MKTRILHARIYWQWPDGIRPVGDVVALGKHRNPPELRGVWCENDFPPIQLIVTAESGGDIPAPYGERYINSSCGSLAIQIPGLPPFTHDSPLNCFLSRHSIDDDSEIYPLIGLSPEDFADTYPMLNPNLATFEIFLEQPSCGEFQGNSLILAIPDSGSGKTIVGQPL